VRASVEKNRVEEEEWRRTRSDPSACSPAGRRLGGGSAADKPELGAKSRRETETRGGTRAAVSTGWWVDGRRWPRTRSRSRDIRHTRRQLVMPAPGLPGSEGGAGDHTEADID
jgi:hypothetical protein